MVSKEVAQTMVQQWLDEAPKQGGPDDMIITHVDEHPWGWMFFYDSRQYLESGNILHAVAGNCPVYVTRDDGVLHGSVTGSGVLIAQHLKLFEGKLKEQGKL